MVYQPPSDRSFSPADCTVAEGSTLFNRLIELAHGQGFEVGVEVGLIAGPSSGQDPMKSTCGGNRRHGRTCS